MQSFMVNTFAFATQECALLSIFHKGTSGKFYITGVEVVPNSPVKTGIGNGPIDVKRQLKRCTEVSGGFELPIRKANLGNADLPEEVIIVRRPDAVTITANSIYRSLLLFPIGVTSIGFRSGGNICRSGGTWQGTGDLWTTSRSSVIQGIILAQGEGFCFGTDDSSSAAYPCSWMLTVTLRNTSTNETYFICTQWSAEEMKESSFAILNGSGSGITLEIVDMELCEIGSPTITSAIDSSILRLIRTTGHDGGGTVLTPIALNQGDSIPSSLDIRKNFTEDDLRPLYATGNIGANALLDFGGYPQVYAGTRRIGAYGQRTAFVGAGGSCGGTAFFSPCMPGKYTFGGMSLNKDNAIVLGPGEGFAIVQSNFTSMSEFYVEAKILYDPATEIKIPVVGNTGLIKVS